MQYPLWNISKTRMGHAVPTVGYLYGSCSTHSGTSVKPGWVMQYPQWDIHKIQDGSCSTHCGMSLVYTLQPRMGYKIPLWDVIENTLWIV
jgi:hypothetical protein